MAFASPFDASHRAAGPMTDINMVPLIDVLLVLLVIFIVSAPLLTHAVKLDLPKTSAMPLPPAPDALNVSIDAQGALFWNGQPVSRAQATERFTEAAAKRPQPEGYIEGRRVVRGDERGNGTNPCGDFEEGLENPLG
mgnify:CR=1 FL=1